MAGEHRKRLSTFNMRLRWRSGWRFLYLPIVILVIYSFNASRLVTVWGGWSLRWYQEFFNDQAMLSATWMSLRVAVVVGHVCDGAWHARRRSRCRGARAFAGGRCFPACCMRLW